MDGDTDGLVEAEMQLDAEDLIAKIGVEERLYRHRCVEAWAMAAMTGAPLQIGKVSKGNRRLSIYG